MLDVRLGRDQRAFTFPEEAADAVFAMPVDQDCPGFYYAASGALLDDYIASRNGKLVKVGKAFLNNDTVYLRTKTSLVAHKSPHGAMPY